MYSMDKLQGRGFEIWVQSMECKSVNVKESYIGKIKNLIKVYK